MSDMLAGPGEAGRWFKAAPRLLVVCGSLVAVGYLGTRLQLGPASWSRAVTLSLVSGLVLPAFWLLVVRHQLVKWGNVGLVAGFFIPFGVVAAPYGRHAPGWVFPTGVALGAVGAWLVRRQFIRIRQTWLTPLAPDLAGMPVTFDVPLARSAGTLQFRPGGIKCGVVPGSDAVVAQGDDAQAPFAWGEISRVEVGEFTVAEQTGPAVRIVLVRGRQLVLPVDEAHGIAAICAARIGSRAVAAPSLLPPSGWRPAATVETR